MSGRGPITTHVLDLANGRPAAGVEIALAVREGESWRELGNGATDGDGRLQTLLAPGTVLDPAVYRLVFDVGAWFAEQGLETFYPSVEIAFEVRDPEQHYHVPLLLSPFGYSTYRGS